MSEGWSLRIVSASASVLPSNSTSLTFTIWSPGEKRGLEKIHSKYWGEERVREDLGRREG